MKPRDRPPPRPVVHFYARTRKKRKKQREVVVDADMAALELEHWTVDGSTNAVVSVNRPHLRGKPYPLWRAVLDENDPRISVTYLNGNRFDCTRANLERSKLVVGGEIVVPASDDATKCQECGAKAPLRFDADRSLNICDSCASSVRD